MPELKTTYETRSARLAEMGSAWTACHNVGYQNRYVLRDGLTSFDAGAVAAPNEVKARRVTQLPSEYVDEPYAHFGLIVAACNRAAPDVAAEVLVENLTKNLPVLVDIVAVGVIDPD